MFRASCPSAGTLEQFTWIHHVIEDPSEKFDAPLKMKIRSITSGNGEEYIGILGRFSKEITPEIKQNLTDTGARIGTTTGSIFTAKCDVTSLYTLAALHGVTLLQLSRTTELK